MENRINIATLLKHCPTGMELDCVMYEDCRFLDVDTKGNSYLIRITTPCGIKYLDKYGCYTTDNKAKCVIFPKGKNTWKGFVPPCQFKNGDVVATTSGAWIGITTGGESGELIPTYCVIKGNGTFEAYTDVKKTWCFSRFATKEERQKLFDEIEAHGYTWNSKTKTLEEITQPNFKVGDWVTDGVSTCQIHSIDDTQYWYSENCILGSIESVDKRYHLWTIQDAKDGDMLFYDSGWACIFNRIHGIWYSSYCFITSEGEFCTGYEEHAVDAKINGKAHPATKEQRTFLLQKIREAGYLWDSVKKILEEIFPYNIGTQVLVKSDKEHKYLHTIVGISRNSFGNLEYEVKEEKTGIVVHYPKELLIPITNDPKFKVGAVIQDKDGYKVRITEVNIEDECYGYESVIAKGIGGITFREQDNWELVPNKFDINTLIPFESKVLVRHNKDNKWTGSVFSFIDRDLHSHCYKFVTTADKSYPMMIPYKGNEYLLGKVEECQDYYKTWEWI